MNRRDAIKTGLAISAGLAFGCVAKIPKLEIVSHRLELAKSHCEFKVKYRADTLHIVLSNGNKAMCWVGNDNILVLASDWSRGLSFEEHVADMEVIEPFARKFFG